MTNPFMCYGDDQLQEITRTFYPTLCDLSTKLMEYRLPRPGQIITVYLPGHVLDIRGVDKPKCKECGK